MINLFSPPVEEVNSTVYDENGGTNDKIAFYQFSKEGKYEQRYVLNYEAASVGANGDTR